MAAEPEEVAWPSNYFNYFTEVEERFRKARGAGLFLMSPLDWALVETWKNAGVPLTAVLRGIDVAFEKWRARKNRIQNVNSVAYCSQAVLAEAQLMAGVAAQPGKRSAAPFSLEELASYLQTNLADLKARAGYEEIAAGLERVTAETESMYRDLEDIERRLTALEDKMVAIARSHQTDDQLLQARRELDQQLRPYRGKMTAEQLTMLEKQYLDRQLLESNGLPRLSLFYLR
ncbi:MAG TPA: hypothetical protein VIX89_03050 [Bryobacteraceae bacterium]